MNGRETAGEAGTARGLLAAALARLRVDEQEVSTRGRAKFAAHAITCAASSIGLLAVLAAVTRSALVFPTLGAIAYTIFVHPRSRSAQPRDVMLGLCLGIGLGYASALAFGLDAGDLPGFEITWRHVGSSSLALALTTTALILARVDLASGCSSSLFVALGVFEPWELAVVAGGGGLLVVLGIVLNRLAGIPHPLWQAEATARRRRARLRARLRSRRAV